MSVILGIWCSLWKKVKILFPYIRYDGWSQSSFPQTLPVKTFKPPANREREVLMESYVVFRCRTEAEWQMRYWHSCEYQLTHLCFWMSFTPFFRFPSLSEGLSLSTQKSRLRGAFWRWKQGIWTLQLIWPQAHSAPYLQSFLMRLAAFLVIFLGNSIMSIPLRMML